MALGHKAYLNLFCPNIFTYCTVSYFWHGDFDIVSRQCFKTYYVNANKQLDCDQMLFNNRVLFNIILPILERLSIGLITLYL